MGWANAGAAACTHSAIYIAHTLVVRTKAEYMCMHPTPTQTIRRALVQCTAVAIRARKQARRAALIIRMSHIQHPPCNWLTCDGSVVARCQVCLHGRCRPRRFPSRRNHGMGELLLLIITSWGAGKRAISKPWAPDYQPGEKKPCFDLCSKEENLPGAALPLMMGCRQIT